MSLPDHIHNELKTLILSHKLSPGASLKIDALSERFQASTIPVREALARLCAQNLVIQEEKVGYKVRPVTPIVVEDDYRTLAAILQIGISDVALKLSETRGTLLQTTLDSIAVSGTADDLDHFLFGQLSSRRLAELGNFCLAHSRYFLALDFELRGENATRLFIRRRKRIAAALLAGRVASAQKLVLQERDWRIENIPGVIKEMLFRQLSV